jgi:hypothetical protein
LKSDAKKPKKVPHPNWLKATEAHRWKAGQTGNPHGCPEVLKAYRWKPGQTGNPRGRPKTKLLSQALRERLAELAPGDPLERTNAQFLADTLFQRAAAGNINALAELMDRAEGKPMQSVTLAASLGITKEEKLANLAEKLKAITEITETGS